MKENQASQEIQPPKVVMGPRWKGKGSEEKALANPISRSILDLKSSLIKSNAKGILSGCSVRLACNPEQTILLNQTCFGRPEMTVDKDQWFQFTLEEAFYLYYSLKCIKIVGGDDSIKTDNDLWEYMTSKKVAFPDVFKAYSHLRDKNWVVRSGCQFGVDFVAYRHHPSLVHSEYAVLVFSERKMDGNDRLRVWSDFQSMLRLCGSVAKTLLILHVNRNGEKMIASSASCLDGYSVEERTITRWSAKSCREDQAVGTKQVVQHEARHFLAGYLLGILPKEYNFSSMEDAKQDKVAVASVKFIGFEFLTELEDKVLLKKNSHEAKPGHRANKNKLSSTVLCKFACVIVGGLVAEHLVYGYSKGHHADVEKLDRVLKWMHFTEDEANTLMRWAVLNTLLILNCHDEARSTLVEAMAGGRSIGNCINMIESTINHHKI